MHAHVTSYIKLQVFVSTRSLTVKSTRILKPMIASALVTNTDAWVWDCESMSIRKLECLLHQLVLQLVS